MATIVDYLHGRGIVVKDRSPEIYIECPGCGTRKDKCSINANKGIGRCFRATCSLHSGFNFLKLITLVEKVSITQAQVIAQRFKDGIENQRQFYNPYVFDYPKGSLPLEDFLEHIERQPIRKRPELESLIIHAAAYLGNIRKLNLKQIVDFQLGVGYENPVVEGKTIPIYGHIIIPIVVNSTIVSYTSRTLEINGMRLNTVKFHHAQEEEGYQTISTTLFNLDTGLQRARERRNLILVEDAWSAIKLDAIALLGANLTDDQTAILKTNYSGPITICLDNDEGGKTAAPKIQLKLFAAGYPDVRIVYPVGVDPDDDLEATKAKINSYKAKDHLVDSILGLW